MIAFRDDGENELIETSFLRKIVKSNQFNNNPKVWKIKAKFLCHEHSKLDFMRARVPDLMHIVYENVFPKRICAVLLDPAFKKLNLSSYASLMKQIKSTNKLLFSSKCFQEVKKVSDLFKSDMPIISIKAIDSKLLTHIFPLYCRTIFDNEISNDYTIISKWLMEFSTYLSLFSCREVPKSILNYDGTSVNLLRESFLCLMLNIQKEISKDKFYFFGKKKSCYHFQYS